MTLVEPSWDDARAASRRAAAALPAESVAVGDAHGRTLAEDCVAATDLPPFTTSAMDGWAVSGERPWRLVGEVLAGSLPAAELKPGEAAAVATGAAVPQGTQAILRREDGESDGTTVKGVAVPAGLHLRPAGEEVAAGEVLVPAGTVLSPAHLGLAAAGGADTLSVRRRPTVHVLVLGDELLLAGPAGGGRVRDSLGPQLPAWLTRLGAQVRAVEHVADTLEAHVEALRRAAGADVVVTTGGTAAGPVDHVHGALRETGFEVLVDSVAVRPGHPMLLAAHDQGSWVLGLPGNPQSAVVALLSLGTPLLDGLLGRPEVSLGEVTLSEAVTAPPRETRLALATRAGETVAPVRHLGSGMLRGLAAADGFALVPPGGVDAGKTVRWLPLP